ncbi:2OG-Fe(II) oxygenase [Thalassotalea sediminis]|uniref:2OG-Fe(II) oxygenase n=1 Tax=Thalassotalea sediminis TaxID=1759089 RepID=UPI0025746CD2|nr:2OG-Fe(II) oxygenase [Thalassotalea sediminis]
MVALKKFPTSGDGNTPDDTLFGHIANDLQQQGYSIRHGALPLPIALALFEHQQSLSANKYSEAGIGRHENFVKNEFIRTDEICWINGDADACKQWIDWTSKLQTYLNQRLFLGLFSFESHFAHYAPGDYYKRHYDAFKGEANRVLSVVTYLNPGWNNNDNGELVIYHHDQDLEGTKVVPLFGTVVIFLSEEFPHEVLPATRDRFSIAGWFRVNTSIANAIDPPR